ncbi:MAG TPA: hypothetical protein VK540_15915 [Polyangiaceae bacterium]|nr:hypothetical protein [Polyangiaceae bacterium]
MQSTTEKALSILQIEQDEQKAKRLAQISAQLAEADRREQDLAHLAELTATCASARKEIEALAGEVGEIVFGVAPLIEKIEKIGREALIASNAARVISQEHGVVNRCTQIGAMGIVGRAVGERFRAKLDLARRLTNYIQPRVDNARTRGDD